ncbi:hypothetical protein [Streptosporangium sp. NPDC051022]
MNTTSTMPPQSAPVKRTITGTAVSNSSGVVPSGLLDELGKIASPFWGRR